MKTKTILITLISLLAVITLIFQACNKEEEETNQHPSCTITSPSEGDIFIQGVTVTISVNANDTDGSIAKVIFFVDGKEKSSATSSPFNWDWDTGDENIGSHTLKATSTDNEGAGASDEVTIVIIEQEGPPESAFKAFPTCGVPPLSVEFTDQSTNDPTSWQWDFGDGNASTEENPSHTYNSDGPYTVTLTVGNSSGSDIETKIDCINVSANGCFDVFQDPRDGQDYNTVTIGEQTWFAENLNYESENSWCFKDNASNCNVYGRIYKWQEALIACPTGWHLPHDEEWKIMEMYLGMSQSEADRINFRGTDEGKKLKSTSGWYQNGNGTDAVGFNGLAGGWSYPDGSAGGLTMYGIWWTAAEKNAEIAWVRSLQYDYDKIDRGFWNKGCRYYVRCVRDF